TTSHSCGKSGIHFSFKKSPRCLPCLCFPLWKGIPHLWNEFFSLERRIILPFVVYNTSREDFSLFGNLSQLSDNFPQFTQLLGTKLFHASLERRFSSCQKLSSDSVIQLFMVKLLSL